MSRTETTNSAPNPDLTDEPRNLWQKLKGKAEQFGDDSVAKAHAVADIITPLVEKVEDSGNAMVAATRTAAKKVAEAVDPTAVGGAVASMSAGEFIGGAVGGMIGAIGGPGGAILGAELGVFAGTSIGAKLGYDVTHEVVHPDEVDPDITFGERAKGVVKTLATRAGDTLGGGGGAAGGGMVGTLLAGPLGGQIGAFIGESLVGELGENSAVEIYTTADRTMDGDPQAPEKQPSADAEKSTGVKAWLHRTVLDTAGETSAETLFAGIGATLAGPLGRKIGTRAGLVAARHVDWSKLSDEQREAENPAKPAPSAEDK